MLNLDENDSEEESKGFADNERVHSTKKLVNNPWPRENEELYKIKIKFGSSENLAV